MSQVLNIILCIVAFILIGVFATFLVIANIYKEKLWDEINKGFYNGRK